MELMIIGVVTALNFIVIKVKFSKKRYEDAVADIAIFATLALLFAGTYAGLVVAMVASLVVSFYLLLSPPKTLTNLLSKAKNKAEEARSRR